MTEKEQGGANAAIISNRKLRDSSSKVIFEDNTLSSQFLRDYADLDILRHIQPEDVEDVSGRYVPLYSVERNSDTVKRVDISRYLPVQESEKKQELPLYIISLVEHKTRVEYNVIMQILRYVIHIWEDYEREMEKLHPGISRRKDFRYPPILPIVYYEGTENWTASNDLAEKILHGELLGKYLPHFRYQLVMLHDYSNEELLAKSDEISLAMLINKMQTFEDVSAFTDLPAKGLEIILRETPDYLLGKIADVLRALLYRMELPENTVEDTVAKIKERKMGILFENIKMNIPEEKRKAEVARQEKERIEREIEVIQQEKEVIEQEKEAIEQEKKVVEQEKEAIEQEKKVVEQEKEAIEQEKKVVEQEKETIQQERDLYKYAFDMTRQGHSDEAIMKSLMLKFSLDEERARQIVYLQ
ncbi:MAG: Rpn family recombination-promoting nuclease/putative transposase [bacterium]|nr:Rpn family recombination-promoting nuclease/putative transposase [bacterium]MCM1375544.1 Rpn family recombination-promoting nuclease/putative transposase [Muribaculum sp.]